MLPEWVLIILILGPLNGSSRPTVTTVEDFHSQRACVDAGVKVKADLEEFEHNHFKVYYSCVQK